MGVDLCCVQGNWLKVRCCAYICCCNPSFFDTNAQLSWCLQLVKKKPPFSAVCSWLFHESPKRFNLPLPQLKLPPSHWSKGGLKHSPTIPCTAIWPIIVQLLSRWGRVWWWWRCRFPFLMSAVRFQVCGFLSCRARTIWSHIGVSFSAFDSAVSLLEKDIIFSQITANHLDLLTQACLFYWLLNWATALFCLI